ncbi:MAG: hypothetical protein AAGA58_09310, partial [Verrucomicrobiota bacterium]
MAFPAILANIFTERPWSTGAQILAVAIVGWFLFRPFRKSDEARTAVGIIVILVAIALLAGFFELKILEWVAQLAAVVFVVVLVVAYQPEIRRTMGEIANNGIFLFSGNRAADLKDQLEQAVRQLSSKRFGALIAIERRVDLRTALET